MSPELTVEGDIRWSGMLSWETTLTVEHVCIHGLKFALNPWLYSASRMNSSFRQPPGSCSGSGTTLGQAVVLSTANLHLYSVRKCHQPCCLNGSGLEEDDLLWPCPSLVAVMPGVQCAKRLVLPRVSWICFPLYRDRGTNKGEALPKFILAAAWFRKEMSQILSCEDEVVKPGCYRPSSIPLKSLGPLPLIK